MKNMEFRHKLPIPKVIKERYPLTERLAAVKAARDADIAAVFTGKSDKLVLIVGPCSADREDAFALKALPGQTFLLRWLLEGKNVPAKGQFKTFREMPWGELYIQPFTGRCLTRAAFTFGTRVAKFAAAMEKLGGTKLPHGDAGYELELLPGFAMRLIVWEGDDEFPPNSQILYSDNFETAFSPEDRVVAGDILISVVKSTM